MQARCNAWRATGRMRGDGARQVHIVYGMQTIAFARFYAPRGGRISLDRFTMFYVYLKGGGAAALCCCAKRKPFLGASCTGTGGAGQFYENSLLLLLLIFGAIDY